MWFEQRYDWPGQFETKVCGLHCIVRSWMLYDIFSRTIRETAQRMIKVHSRDHKAQHCTNHGEEGGLVVAVMVWVEGEASISGLSTSEHVRRFIGTVLTPFKLGSMQMEWQGGSGK